MAKAKTTNQGNKHPMPSSRKRTRSPGGGETAGRKKRAKQADAYNRMYGPKSKRFDTLEDVVRSVVPIAGAAGKVVSAVRTVQRVKTVKNLYDKTSKANFESKNPGKVSPANKAMRELSRKKYPADKLVRRVHGKNATPAQSKFLKEAYGRATRLDRSASLRKKLID